MSMVVFEVKWGSKKFSIELNQEEYEAMTVLDLKLKCQELTDIEPEFMKLLAQGKILKNNELLKDCKIMTGSKVLLMGSKNHLSPIIKIPPPKKDASIATRLAWIRNLRESVLKPDIARYEKRADKHVLQQASHNEPNNKQTKELVNYGNDLQEQLMKILSQLDTMPEAVGEEKTDRKDNVKETELLLDLLEKIRSKLTFQHM